MAPVVVAALSSSSNTANSSCFAAAIAQTCFSSLKQPAIPPWEPNSSSVSPLHLSRSFPCLIPGVSPQRQHPIVPVNPACIDPSARSHSLNAPSPSLGNNLNSAYASQHHSSFRCRGLDAVGLRKACLHVARASPLKGRSRQVLHRGGEQPSGLELHKPSLASEHETESRPVEISAGEFTTNRSRRGSQEADDVEPDKGAILESKSDKERQSNESAEQEGDLITGDTALKGTIVAGLLLVGLVGGFGTISYLYKDQINDFLVQLSDFIEGYGPAGYGLFVAVYTGLEILAIPAIPLTMSAGLLFGTVIGTTIVSISGTIAATTSFLIARYLARDRILKLAEGNKKFLAIDKAIGEDGFKVVTLLRLSPLLPFSLGNYLYGLTSVKLVPYICGSWLGMLPGTWAYVSAGALGRAIIQEEAETGHVGSSEQLWTVGLGLLATIFAATYVTRLAKDAIKDIE